MESVDDLKFMKKKRKEYRNIRVEKDIGERFAGLAKKLETTQSILLGHFVRRLEDELKDK